MTADRPHLGGDGAEPDHAAAADEERDDLALDQRVAVGHADELRARELDAQLKTPSRSCRIAC